MSLFPASVEENTANNSPSNGAGENGLRSAAGGECFNSSGVQSESGMQEDIDLLEFMLNLPSLSGTPEEFQNIRAVIPASSVGLQGPTLVHPTAFRSQNQVHATVQADHDAHYTLKNRQVGGPVDSLDYPMHSNLVPSGQVSPDCPPVDSRCLQPLSGNWGTKFRQEGEQQRLRNSHRYRPQGVPDSDCPSKNMLISIESVEENTTKKLLRHADVQTERLVVAAGEECLEYWCRAQSKIGTQEDIPWQLNSQTKLPLSNVIQQLDQTFPADFKHAANVDPGQDDFTCGSQLHRSNPKDTLEIPGVETEELSESERKPKEICFEQCVSKLNESCTSAPEGRFKPTQGVGINLLNKGLLPAERADTRDSMLRRPEPLIGFDVSDIFSGPKARNVTTNSNTVFECGMEGGIPVQPLLGSPDIEQSDEQIFQEGGAGAHSSFSVMLSVEGREKYSKKRHHTGTLPVGTIVARIDHLDPPKAIHGLTVEDLIAEKINICNKMLGNKRILELETSLYHMIKVHEKCIEERKPFHIHKECKSKKDNTAEKCCWSKQFGTNYPDDQTILRSFRQLCTRAANLAGSDKSGRIRLFPDWLVEEFKDKLKSLQNDKGVTILKNEEVEAYAESLGLKPSQVLYKLKRLRDERGSEIKTENDRRVRGKI